MTEHNHAVVWMDGREARVFHFTDEDVETLVVHPHGRHIHIHHRADTIGGGKAPEDQAFLDDVIKAIGQSKAVLVTGPGMAKTALVKHIARHDPRMMENIAGVESVDHPTDGALVAHARAYFKAADRLTPQLPSNAGAGE
jgi:stalled ribosome rescue protein Dom34